MNETTTITSINFSKEILKKADEIVEKRLIPGVTNRSGLVEYALDKLFKEVFKEDQEVSNRGPQ